MLLLISTFGYIFISAIVLLLLWWFYIVVFDGLLSFDNDLNEEDMKTVTIPAMTLFKLTSDCRKFEIAHSLLLPNDYNSIIKLGDEDYINIRYVEQLVKESGYSIEITETSSAGSAVGSVKGKNWHRTHQFRWSIVYWDKNDTMISLKYSDSIEMPENMHFFSSEMAALESALNYIIVNYECLEK